MDLGDASSWFLVPLQILLVDLLLGADNALVIALACRNLPPQDIRRAAAIGVFGAILIRTLLAVVATALLALPLVKIIGALALVVIAMNLVSGEELDEDGELGAKAGHSLWSAAAIIRSRCSGLGHVEPALARTSRAHRASLRSSATRRFLIRKYATSAL